MTMKIRMARLAAATLLLGCGWAQADAPPSRKSGLWEMDNRVEGVPAHGPMQICIDQQSDDLIRQRPDPVSHAKPDCSVIESRREAGGRLRLHTVCKVDDKTTATTDAVIRGDFASSYRSESRVRFAPPLEGRAEMNLVSQGRWLGPCKPGQKPGDFAMPGMPGMPAIPGGQQRMQELMNDPKLRELMKRHGPGG